jgi:protein-arginine kinase activator protein McsA
MKRLYVCLKCGTEYRITAPDRMKGCCNCNAYWGSLKLKSLLIDKEKLNIEIKKLNQRG